MSEAVPTFLEAVNKVLARLREPSVSAVGETEYSTVIGELVRQANSEIEDAWDWQDLRTTIQITTSEGIFDYSLPSAGRSFRVLQVHEDTKDYDLYKPPSYSWMNSRLLANDPNLDAPRYWDWNGRTSEGDPIINLYPIPDQPYLVNFNMKIKVSLDDDACQILAPPLPIILRATQLAIEERGDDGGPSASTLAQQASMALADAVSYDSNMYPEEVTWRWV